MSPSCVGIISGAAFFKHPIALTKAKPGFKMASKTPTVALISSSASVFFPSLASL